MNDSNNTSEKKKLNREQKYIELLGSIISSLKNNPLSSLEELSNEYYLYLLILEIEPKFENIPTNNIVELINDYSNYEIRYKNMVSILTAVVNYKNESKSKDKFTKETDFLNLNINDFLNNEKEQLIKIAEMLCFLTIISSNKNYFIQKVNEIDDNQISNLYYTIIEKYITFKIDESTTSVVKKTNIFNDNSPFQIQTISTYNNNNNDNNTNISNVNNSDTEEKIKVVNSNKITLIRVDSNDNNNIENITQEKLKQETKMQEKEEENDDINININDLNEKYIENDPIFEHEKEKLMLSIKLDSLNRELSEVKTKYEKIQNEKILLTKKIDEIKVINNNLVNKINKHVMEEEKLNVKLLEELNIINNLNTEVKDKNFLIENIRKENEKMNNEIKKINNEKQILELQKEKGEMDLHQLQKEIESLKGEYKKK
jgi:hypothetical protein